MRVPMALGIPLTSISGRRASARLTDPSWPGPVQQGEKDVFQSRGSQQLSWKIPGKSRFFWEMAGCPNFDHTTERDLQETSSSDSHYK
jgi:hypothetical protein